MTVPQKSQEPNTQHQELCVWLQAVSLKRDKQAFSKLFKWFAPRIRQFGIKQFNNEAQASELVQETMTNIWRKAHLYDQSKGAPTTWMYSIMRNMSFDMLRKFQTQRTESISDDIWPLDNALATDDVDHFNDHLQSRNVTTLLDILPENQRQIIFGLYFQQTTSGTAGSATQPPSRYSKIETQVSTE
ncbi:sigma-70 family RNA polymerase sigma factor [Paraglaciecola aquimarina]|uniref:Sigma-70 family RNA polymerase sigma factor n=1 Tax=Paraglaciecola aquimarina TaxID=1235557 RepID=A0ABU3SXI3_9ALTE|nr:sigma-70 family RNA polymerase sigma factor [Paraglaciecola aquimarina]MDU0354713.1 sigma-70 family RNA polymerase sigma factor [Paraglaciecola aquimarina]